MTGRILRRDGPLRRRARAGSRAFELIGFSLAGVVPVLLTVLALAAAVLGTAAVSASLIETGRGWAQQYRRLIPGAVPDPYAPAPAPSDTADDRATDRRRLAGLLRDHATWRDLAWALAAPLSGLVVLGLPMLVGTAGVVLLCAGVWQAVSGRAVPLPTPAPGWLGIPLGVLLWGLSLLVVPQAVALHCRLAGALLRPTSAAQVRKLTADRAGLVEDRARELRRIERDLHDGTQARLVALGLSLGMARSQLHASPEATDELLAEAQRSVGGALDELRALVRGIHPPVLAERGLAGAVQSVALSAAVPVHLEIDLPARFEPPVESALYFAAAEALTNVGRHSGAGRAELTLAYRRDRLVLTVADDGTGGADPGRGSGLRGIRDRLAAFDGTMALTSPHGGPTEIRMELPCAPSSPKTSPSSATA